MQGWWVHSEHPPVSSSLKMDSDHNKQAQAGHHAGLLRHTAKQRKLGRCGSEIMAESKHTVRMYKWTLNKIWRIKISTEDKLNIGSWLGCKKGCKNKQRHTDMGGQERGRKTVRQSSLVWDHSISSQCQHDELWAYEDGAGLIIN